MLSDLTGYSNFIALSSSNKENLEHAMHPATIPMHSQKLGIHKISTCTPHPYLSEFTQTIMA